MYEIDEYLNIYLSAALPESRYKMYINIFKLLHNLNITSKNGNNIDIENIEHEMNEVIHLDDEETDSKIIKLDNLIKNILIGYFKRYGIYLNLECTLRELEELLQGYYNFLNIDKDMVEYILMQLEDMEHEDDMIKLATILDNHCGLDVTAIYEMIDDVREDIFVNLCKYFESLVDANGNPITDNSIDIVLFLTDLDSMYNNTYILKDLIKNGYRAVGINMLVNDMYTNISKQLNDISNIPYEIVGTLYIAVDTRSDIITWFKENFNYDILGSNNTDAGRNYINETIDILISKIFEKSMNEGLSL